MMTLSIMVEYCYAVSFMLTAIMLNVIMLSVTMSNVIILSVVALWSKLLKRLYSVL